MTNPPPNQQDSQQYNVDRQQEDSEFLNYFRGKYEREHLCSKKFSHQPEDASSHQDNHDN
jgi:hypothetical protein